VVEFNNEVVYELADESKKEVKEYFGNLNLMSVKDVKLEDGNILKIKSFHNLNSNSGLLKKLINKTLGELKIPYNDIIILRKDENEVYIEFDSIAVFK
jgi:hypothetical protein